MDTKACCMCGQIKSLDLFYVNRKAKDGRQRECKTCNNVKTAQWREKNPDHWRQKQRDYKRAAKYGISPKEYREMWSRSEGRCEICNRPLEQRKGGVAVDHCHVNGQVRGLLCQPCNQGLGFFQDDSERLLAAAAYLKDRT